MNKQDFRRGVLIAMRRYGGPGAVQAQAAQAKAQAQAKKVAEKSAKAQRAAGIRAMAREEMARQHDINALWPGAAPSRGPWEAAFLGNMQNLQEGLKGPSRVQVMIGLGLSLGVGFLVGQTYGKRQRAKGKSYSFGVPQAAAVLLVPGLGIGYQAGRYLAHGR